MPTIGDSTNPPTLNGCAGSENNNNRPLAAERTELPNGVNRYTYKFAEDPLSAAASCNCPVAASPRPLPQDQARVDESADE